MNKAEYESLRAPAKAKREEERAAKKSAQRATRKARVNECGHPDRKHQAKGMCNSCYVATHVRGGRKTPADEVLREQGYIPVTEAMHLLGVGRRTFGREVERGSVTLRYAAQDGRRRAYVPQAYVACELAAIEARRAAHAEIARLRAEIKAAGTSPGRWITRGAGRKRKPEAPA